VSNNTGTPVAYFAALYRGDPIDRNIEVTTTCGAESGKAAIESWPYLVDGMVILKYLQPSLSDKALCVDPTKNCASRNGIRWMPNRINETRSV
jgi:hypothetical protein